MSKLSYPVRPGGLSETDQDRIFSMAERGRTACAIARKIEKHPSTVYSMAISLPGSSGQAERESGFACQAIRRQYRAIGVEVGA